MKYETALAAMITTAERQAKKAQPHIAEEIRSQIRQLSVMKRRIEKIRPYRSAVIPATRQGEGL